MRGPAGLLIIAAAALAAVPATAQARTYCGHVYTYAGKTKYTRTIYRLKGHVSCTTARAVIRASMKKETYGHPKGWSCVMLHARGPYDITCGSPRGAEDYTRAVGSVLEGH
jgi:hypothetical protein